MFNTKDAAFILRSIVLKGPYNKIIKIRDVNRTVIHQMVFFTYFSNHKVIGLYKHIILSMLSCKNVINLRLLLHNIRIHIYDERQCLLQHRSVLMTSRYLRVMVGYSAVLNVM